MRKIKFRAWENGRMDYSPSTIQKMVFGDKPNTAVLMQFTELLDKNGKEIWESDYLLRPKGNLLKGEGWQEVKASVRYVAEHGGFCWADWRLDKDIAATCEVVGNEYEGDKRYPLSRRETSHVRGDQPNEAVEIIGNIYENPNLLKR
jgi:uncharacterized phage protein (TIGR01671 family)